MNFHNKPTKEKTTQHQEEPSIDKLQFMADQLNSLLQQGDAAGALMVADTLAQTAPHIQGIHHIRSVCLSALGKHEEALKAVEQELTINPNHAQARAEYEKLLLSLSQT